MYRSCIFCSADLGTNEAIEEFPVGRRLAFDAWKGRLWVVCPKCTRWNLSPLEERWEAVESAEKLFRDSRLRVQSENIGLAKLPDGTRLIRVGEALPGELAAWRYGDQLVRRRRQYLIASGAMGAGALAYYGGMMMVMTLGIGGLMVAQTVTMLSRPVLNRLSRRRWERERRQVIYRIEADRSPTGCELAIRRWQLAGAYLGPPDTGEGIALRVPDVTRDEPIFDRWGRTIYSDEVLVLPDHDSRAALGRAMVHLNRKGASRSTVQRALQLLSSSYSAEGYLRRIASSRAVLGWRSDRAEQELTPVGSLALEMALHEESERRALEGELASLEAAWREAEEIAQIADVLPDDPLEKLAGEKQER